MNLLSYELFRGLLALRRDPDDPEGPKLLGHARERARRMGAGQASIAVLLDSVNATDDERRLASE